jgi:hypothetical protein
LDERLDAARKLELLDPHCPIVVDTMNDSANKAYGALYERLYIVIDGVIVYEGGRGPMWYKIEEVEGWLKMHFKS